MLNKQETSFRKLDHVEICLQENTQSHQTTRLEDFHFIPKALADTNFGDLDVSTNLFGKKLGMPIMIAAMTGGHPEVRTLNESIATTAEKFHLAMGVGSERAALENKNEYVIESFKVVRDLAPSILLMGNLGAAQFCSPHNFSINEVQKAIELIQADALAIHVNPAQEVVQMEGDTNFDHFWENINSILPNIPVPVIFKEVGSGFSREDAMQMSNSKIAGLDVGGVGGTSWVAVESLRAKRKNQRLAKEIGEIFWDWGIPTALSVIETRSVLPDKVIIATGGARNGLEVAKLLALGADIVGMATPFLQVASKGQDELDFFVRKIEKELKMVLFLTGCHSLQDLRSVPMVVTDFSKHWLEQRNIDFNLVRNSRK